MALPTPHPGLVICYAYIWAREHDEGHEEGTKDRPCAIVLTTEEIDGEKIVTVAPITHRASNEPGAAVEIPQATKRRLGLDSNRSWIVISETNSFIWPGPDLRPVDRHRLDEFAYGVLPPRFFRQVRDKLVALYKTRRLRNVMRSK